METKKRDINNLKKRLSKRALGNMWEQPTFRRRLATKESGDEGRDIYDKTRKSKSLLRREKKGWY